MKNYIIFIKINYFINNKLIAFTYYIIKHYNYINYPKLARP